MKSPKVYLRDSGILHHLLGIRSFDQLVSHLIVENSWEGYAIEQIISEGGTHLEYFYYRTQGGTECDLVIAKSGRPIACVEIKFSDTPHRTKSFTSSIQDLQTPHNFLVIPNAEEQYPLGENIIACSLETFLSEYLPKL